MTEREVVGSDDRRRRRPQLAVWLVQEKTLLHRRKTTGVPTLPSSTRTLRKILILQTDSTRSDSKATSPKVKGEGKQRCRGDDRRRQHAAADEPTSRRPNYLGTATRNQFQFLRTCVRPPPLLLPSRRTISRFGSVSCEFGWVSVRSNRAGSPTTHTHRPQHHSVNKGTRICLPTACYSLPFVLDLDALAALGVFRILVPTSRIVSSS